MGNVLRRSGSATPSSKQPPASPEKDHETNVQFAREFVEELVEKLPSDSVSVLPEKEDTTRYSVAYSDISAFSETSLPDLLQPEAQYKKQADTDTDTTDYESAVESDALSLNASLGLDRSDPVSSPEIFNAASSPSTDSASRVLQGEIEAFEDAEAFEEGRSTPHLDVSSLCLDVGRLSLDSPQRPSVGSSKEDSFLVTLNPGCQIQSTDTSFNTSDSDLPRFVLGTSFIEKSICGSSLHTELLSTTFEVGPTGEVSTEYNLEIIRNLEFDLEKPVASETDIEESVSCNKNGLLPEVAPVSPVFAAESADVAENQSVKTVSVDLQVTDSQEFDKSETCAEPAKDAGETRNHLQSEVETELLHYSPVDADLEATCKELQLVASEEDSILIGNKVSTREEVSTATEVDVQSVSFVEDNSTEVLPAPELELSSQEEQSSVTESEVPSVPVVGDTTEVLPAPELELSSQEEQSSVTESEVPSVPVGDNSTEVLPAPELELSSQEEHSSVTESEVPSVPVGDNSTEVLPAPEPELSSQEEKSTVTELEAVPSELVPTVEETETEVLSPPKSDLSSPVVAPFESDTTVESNTFSSSEPESSVNAESSLVVDKSNSSVEPQESISLVEPVQTEPASQDSVIPNQEFASASSTEEPQVVNELIVESAESEPIGNLSFVVNKEPANEDLPVVGIKEVELHVDVLDALIGKTAEKTPIIVCSEIANKEPANFEDSQATVPNASASVAFGLATKRAVSPCQITADEPELHAISSEPVNFSSCDPTLLAGRKCTISPSFLLIGNNTFEQEAPILANSVLNPVATYQQPSADSHEQTDVIDPVGAVWSRDVNTTSCFSAPPPQANPIPCVPKKETPFPIVNPIQFRGSPLYPETVQKSEAIPFVVASQLESLVPSRDPFSPIPVKTEPGAGHFTTKSFKSTNAFDDQSLNDLREICQRQQRELDNQQFSSKLFGESQYNSVAIANIAAEAAKVSEDIHNASIEQAEFEMDENVNPVPLDKKWLSERSAVGVKVEAKEPAKSRNILGGGDGFDDCLDKQNKNIMTASIDAQTNQSEAGPEIALQDEEETFADSEGFDFLSAKASTGPSDRLVRESLYTKFDPLAAPTPPSAAAPAVRNPPLPMPPKFSENDNKISPPAGQLIQLAPTPVASTPPRSSTPCANEGPTETTPPKNSAARALVDRLISLSPAGRNIQASPVKPPPPVVKSPLPPTMERMSEELVLLRELLSEEDMAHKVSLAALEEKLKVTEQELHAMRLKAKAAEEREQKMIARLGEKVTSQKQLAAVMCEYEKTISKLVGEKENDRTSFIKEKEALVKEKDVALGHLTNIEIAFSDVHQKYERCKTVVEAFKSNEDVLRETLAKYEATIHKQEQKYDMLKAHAMTQLENANQELDAVRRNQATESAKLKAMLKKSELKTSSLEEMLEQKVKENSELASICDDLIAKVGT